MTNIGLKMLTLILMLLDRIGEYMPVLPLWFSLLGNALAVLLFFCIVWGIVFVLFWIGVGVDTR